MKSNVNIRKQIGEIGVDAEMPAALEHASDALTRIHQDWGWRIGDSATRAALQQAAAALAKVTEGAV
jgi:hypothetical protein